MRSRHLLLCGTVLLAIGLCGGEPARAQGEADFYAGKTVNLVIGSGTGGVFDNGGRLMARFLKKHIPGNPNVVVRNMPGASSVLAASFLFNAAPRDGLTLGTFQPTIVLAKSLDPDIKYQPEQFTWIGRVQPILFAGLGWTASGFKSIADARAREVVVSAQGALGMSALVPRALNRLAGTHFRVVTGYEAQAHAFIAMERGEVQGIGSGSLTDVLEKKEWWENKRIAVIYNISAKRSPLAPDAPAIPELANDAMGRDVLSVIGRGVDSGQALLAPPQIPAERLALLRKGFDAMVKDPELVQEGAKLGLRVDPLDGATLTELVTSASTIRPEVLEKLRAVVKP